MLGYLQADVSWKECLERGEFKYDTELKLICLQNIIDVIEYSDLEEPSDNLEDYDGQFVDFVMYSLELNKSSDDKCKIALSQSEDYIKFCLIIFAGVKSV